jgi:hypothetical protein
VASDAGLKVIPKDIPLIGWIRHGIYNVFFFSKKNTIGNNIEPQLGTKMCGF